ncbi:MAG TPA: L,D-transpeptidase family protein [Sphingomicrobium sp.]|nr:L,D-transpeptidase family protein [Sphingomicrobium sp.]
MRTGILSAALASLVFHPGTAEAAQEAGPAPMSLLQGQYQSAGLPSSAEVQAFYRGWRYAPIWFNGNAAKPEAAALVQIMQRSSLDGISAGPQYAAQLQAALQQAASGNPQAISYAEHSLSEALVLYAQAMERPIPGMIYGYEYMRPKPPSASDVLRLASAVPSLQAYLLQVANPNSIYVGIRDAAWQQMQSKGSTIADPRVVANLERARGMPAKGKFVMVNSATQMLYMYDNNVPVGSMKVVVGDYNKYIPRWMPTPLVTSVMFYVIHNPYWNAPDFLVQKNIAPRYLAEGDKYFKYRGYNVMSDWTKNATILPASSIDWHAVKAGKLNPRVRQDPGPDNFMGALKLPFENPEGIYLHDTDNEDRKLFTYSERTRSNGCIRLEDAPRLATWLLGHPPVAASSEAEFPEQLPRGVPIYVTYLTAQPENGQLTFVKDIYNLDPGGDSRVASGK